MDVCYATILVLVVTNQRILLAADSRKTYLDKNGVHKTGTIDKIYETNECYYAVCGFHEEVNGFSIHHLLHNCLAKFADFHHAVSQITHVLAAELKNYFTNLKNNSPAIFQQVRNSGGAAGEVFLIKNHKNIPTAFVLDYQIAEGRSLKVKVTSRSTTVADISPNSGCFWRVIGNTGPLLSSLLEKDWAVQPEFCATQIIEEGSKRSPTFVSLPINMMELKSTGMRWIENTASAPNNVFSSD